METARFLISLTRTHNHQCLVEKRVRRADQSRAVLYAQTWLHKTQKLALYCGVTYDMYEIFKQDETGTWILLESGNVSDATMGRQRAIQDAHKEVRQESATKSRSRKKTATKTGRQDDGLQLFPSGRIPRSQTKQRNRKTLSPLQQQLSDMRDQARQLAVEARKRGNQL